MKLAIHFFNEKKTSINWLNQNVGQLLRHAAVWRSDHRLYHKSNLFSCCFDCLWHNSNTLSRLTPNTFQVVQAGWFRLTSSSALGKNNCVFILQVFNVCICASWKLRWDKTWQEKQAEDESDPHTFHHQCHRPYARSYYAIFSNGIREKRGKNPIFSKSSVLPSVFALISAAFSLFFRHHSAALPSDAGRLKGSPRAAAARRSAARCINRPLNWF